MKLTKQQPARTVSWKINWLKKDFSKYTAKFRNIRASMRNKLDKCGWCKSEFADGDTIALASVDHKANQVLCQDCAEKVEP